jgi:hypothetical protein
MISTPYVHDRALADAATELISAFGCAAFDEADARARLSRDRGNVVKFCRWRQVGHLIRALDTDGANVTVH